MRAWRAGSRCARRSSMSSWSSSWAASLRASSCAASTRSTCSSGRWRGRCRPASRAARRRGSGSRSPPGSRANCARRSRTSSHRRACGRRESSTPREVQRLVSEHLSGRRDHRKQLWTLFVFQLWHRRWVEERWRACRRSSAVSPCEARVKPSLVDDLLCPVSRRSAAGRVRRARATSSPAGSYATGADATGRFATASRGSFLPISGSSSVRPHPRSAGSGSTSPSSTPSSRPSSSTGSIRSIAEFFEGKRVLDAGCGTGRHAYLAARFGAREVVAVDLSGAVDAARVNLEALDNVHVVQGDLLRLPLRPADRGGGFDLIYSIGVLHHLPDPHAGFRSLLPYLRPGGTIAVWLYGYENNGFVRHAVEPLRRVTTKLPRSGAPRRRVAARRRLSRRRQGRVPAARAIHPSAGPFRSTST